MIAHFCSPDIIGPFRYVSSNWNAECLCEILLVLRLCVRPADRCACIRMRTALQFGNVLRFCCYIAGDCTTISSWGISPLDLDATASCLFFLISPWGLVVKWKLDLQIFFIKLPSTVVNICKRVHILNSKLYVSLIRTILLIPTKTSGLKHNQVRKACVKIG